MRLAVEGVTKTDTTRKAGKLYRGFVMRTQQAPATMDDYIETFPPEVRRILETIRQTVREALPDAEETMSYGMPAFKRHGILVYFAAFKKHIGLYPPVRGSGRLMRSVAPYAGPKGNLQFPLDKPIPYALIGRIVKVRAQAIKEKALGKGRSRLTP